MTWLASVGVLAFVFAPAFVNAATTLIPARAISSYLEVEWLRSRDYNTVARGLTEFHRRPTHDETVLFLSTHSGGRYVFNHIADAAAGTSTSSVTDDLTGWRFDVVTHLGMPGGSPGEWYRRFDPEQLKPGYKVKVEARSNSGLHAGPLQTDYSSDNREYKVLLVEPAAEEFRDAVARELPERLRADLPNLLAAFTLENQHGFHFRRVLSTLAGIVDMGAEGERTVVKASRLSPDDARVRALKSEFIRRDVSKD